MKTDTMRRIDRIAGSPLCHLLAPLAGLFAHRPAEARTVVVCKFFGMGSICLAWPLVRALQDAGSRVVFLSFRGNDAVLDFLGIDERISVDPSSPLRFAVSVLGAIRALRRVGPVAFLNLEFFSRFAALVSALSGAPVRAGFHIVHLPVGKLYTHRANLNVYRHIAANFLNVGTAAGLLDDPNLDSDGFDGFPVAEGRPAAGPAGRYIVLNGESSETIRALKSWPAAAWADLIGNLRRRFPDHALVLMGTGVAPAAAIYGRGGDNGAIVDLVGRTSVPELLQVIAGADLVVTVDSGPLHLSALMRRPTVCLFGPETPRLYGHDWPRVRTLYRDLPCSPCLALYDAKQSVLDCTDNQCLKRIAPAEVLAAAEDLIRS